jgi:O-antigen/teichoic acid export membrane protein
VTQTAPTKPSAAERTAFSAIKRRLIRGSAWVFAGKFATIFLGIAINGLLGRMLTEEQFGDYFQVFTLVTVGALVAQLGLDRAVVRFVSAAMAVGEQGKARGAIRVVFGIGMAGSIGLGVVLVAGLGPWLADHVFGSEQIRAAMPFVAGWLVMWGFQSLVVETFRGFHKFNLATIFDQLLRDILAATFVGVLYLANARPSLNEVVLLMLAATALTALVGSALLLGRVRGLGGIEHVDRREIVAYAWPLLITNVAIYLLGSGIDLWVLGAFARQDVAEYAASARLVILVATPFLIIQGVTPPLVAELYAQGRIKEMERALRGIATLAGMPSFLILVVFLLFGDDVLGLIYGRYQDGAPILAILSTSRLYAVWTGSCSVVLMMSGHQRVAMASTLSTAALSIAGGILIAPHFGGVGVACTTAFAQIAQNTMQLLLARKLVGVWTMVHFSPKPLMAFLRAGSSSAEEGRP